MRFCNTHGLPHSTFLDWDPLDQDKALAQELEAAQHCPMCGTAGWEWEENRFAYEAVQERCPGCYAKDLAAKDLDDAPGVTIQLSPTNTPEARERRARAAALAERDRQDRLLDKDD